MTDEAALLAAVLAQPDEDTPRLMYADCLQERGQHERAEFIRVQIQLELESTFIRDKSRQLVREHGAGLLPHAGIHSAYELALRERDLLSTSQVPPSSYSRPAGVRVEAWYAWAGPVANLPDPDRQGWSYRRGFVEQITCTAADWLTHGDTILAQHPVTAVRLTTIPKFKFEFLGGDTAQFVHLPGRIRDKVPAVPHSTTWGHASRCLSASWPTITFELSPPRNGGERFDDLNEALQRLQAARPSAVA